MSVTFAMMGRTVCSLPWEMPWARCPSGTRTGLCLDALRSCFLRCCCLPMARNCLRGVWAEKRRAEGWARSQIYRKCRCSFVAQCLGPTLEIPSFPLVSPLRSQPLLPIPIPLLQNPYRMAAVDPRRLVSVEAERVANVQSLLPPLLLGIRRGLTPLPLPPSRRLRSEDPTSLRTTLERTTRGTSTGLQPYVSLSSSLFSWLFGVVGVFLFALLGHSPSSLSLSPLAHQPAPPSVSPPSPAKSSSTPSPPP